MSPRSRRGGCPDGIRTVQSHLALVHPYFTAHGQLHVASRTSPVVFGSHHSVLSLACTWRHRIHVHSAAPRICFVDARCTLPEQNLWNFSSWWLVSALLSHRSSPPSTPSRASTRRLPSPKLVGRLLPESMSLRLDAFGYDGLYVGMGCIRHSFLAAVESRFFVSGRTR